MRRELQAYLDGEIRREALPAELRAEAERWDQLLADARELGPAGAPAGLESRILNALPDRRPVWRRASEWAIRPRAIRLSPLAGLAAAAALALLVLGPWHERPGREAPAEGATVYVQFVLEAPEARSVAVAGDFNEWSPQVALTDPDGDGVWTGRVALKPGVHQYMFVVDGSRWMTDPRADRYVDDGFGSRNAVLLVTDPAARS